MVVGLRERVKRATQANFKWACYRALSERLEEVLRYSLAPVAESNSSTPKGGVSWQACESELLTSELFGTNWRRLRKSWMVMMPWLATRLLWLLQLRRNQPRLCTCHCNFGSVKMQGWRSRWLPFNITKWNSTCHSDLLRNATSSRITFQVRLLSAMRHCMLTTFTWTLMSDDNSLRFNIRFLCWKATYSNNAFASKRYLKNVCDTFKLRGHPYGLTKVHWALIMSIVGISAAKHLF